MKPFFLLLPVFMASSVLASFGQQTGRRIPPELTDGIEIRTHSSLYNAAYLEMADMLDGRTPLSVKRAVFLAEWAYLDGNIDYGEYCRGIDTVAVFLNKFVAANDLGQYRTAGNFALFEYFCRPYSGNGYTPFTYDYEDFGGTEDFTKLFVTKLIRTHTGQCRSLPVYYKVLAEAIGAEAHIAFAPQHLFVRHRDETDPTKWVNVELTTHSLSREIFYIENFGISDAAIRNKVYLYPLTDTETVAYLLSEMAMGYNRKYGEFDDLVWLCALKSLEYYPQNIVGLHQKANVLNTKLMQYLAGNGDPLDETARSLDGQWRQNFDLIHELGWTEMSDELYADLMNATLEVMSNKGRDETDGQGNQRVMDETLK